MIDISSVLNGKHTMLNKNGVLKLNSSSMWRDEAVLKLRLK